MSSILTMSSNIGASNAAGSGGGGGGGGVAQNLPRPFRIHGLALSVYPKFQIATVAIRYFVFSFILNIFFFLRLN